MAYEQEDLYENVVFRNSQIIYPPDMASSLTPSTTADSRLLRVEDTANMSTRPRQSLLEAFDPVLQRKSIHTANRPKHSDLLKQLSQIDFSDLTTPPPLPKRNASFKVQHQYDPVAIEHGKVQFQLHVEKPPPALHTDDDSLTSEEEGEFPACPSAPKNVTPKQKVKGLMNKVTNVEWLTGLKRLSTNVSHSKDPDQTDSPITPPFKTPSSIFGVGHAGMMSWNTAGSKRDPQNLWTELKNGVLSAFAGQTTEAPLYVIKLETLVSIGLLFGTEDSLSFELATTKDKSKIVLLLNTAKERFKWMEWILESAYGEVFSSDIRKCFTRSGRVFIKDGITGEWQVAWLLIQSECKKLWVKKSAGQIICEDLRKVHSVSQLNDGGGSPYALQPGSPIIIHWPDHTCYIQSDLKSETEAWYHLSRSVALQSGTELADHQLTADDVPVLIECCIKFIETYGMLTEGIYRRSGVQSKINRLLQGLRVDAWNVHISSEEYTEHDVANVLKRFLRTLPEPLLTNELYSQWIDGLAMDSHERQLDLYKRLIGALPHINRRTLCKLLGHLHAVQNKCEKNLMSVSNLAALWGPNLMTVESARDHTSNFRYLLL